MRWPRLAAWCGLVALIASIGGATTSTATSTGTDRIEHFSFEGRERTYLVHIPPDLDPAKPAPLVLALHYYTGTGRAEAEQTGLSAKADTEGFIVAYPDGPIRGGSGLSWNIWHNPGDSSGKGDVAFVRELIRRLRAQFAIDPKRIYVVGMSQGGMLAHLIGGELCSVVAAVASVGGFMTQKPTAGEPVSVLIIHGTDDKVVPYRGGTLGGGSQRQGRGARGRGGPMGRRVPAVSEAVEAWVSHNGCARKPVTTRRGAVTKDVYGGGERGTEVVVYTVAGGGHVWPGDKNDRSGSGFKATEAVWEFLEMHPKR